MKRPMVQLGNLVKTAINERYTLMSKLFGGFTTRRQIIRVIFFKVRPRRNVAKLLYATKPQRQRKDACQTQCSE
jgi:hypothetical protein